MAKAKTLPNLADFKKFPLGKHDTLVLRVCEKGMRSYNNFRWPCKGYVEAPDWGDHAFCGNGLHGLEWGVPQGDELPHHVDDALDPSRAKGKRWLVVRVDKRQGFVDLGGKCKFKCGYVIYTGTLEKAMDILVTNGALLHGIPVGWTVDSGHLKVTNARGSARPGDNGTAVAGMLGVAESGINGLAAAGPWGDAVAARCGQAIVKFGGHATVGDAGTAVVSGGGKATSGNHGIACGGLGSITSAGSHGIAISKGTGSASTGDFGISVALNGGKVKSGPGGLLVFRTEDTIKVRQVGKGGIKPNTEYWMDNRGKVKEWRGGCDA